VVGHQQDVVALVVDPQHPVEPLLPSGGGRHRDDAGPELSTAGLGRL
jgi:hypothetical protein